MKRVLGDTQSATGTPRGQKNIEAANEISKKRKPSRGNYSPDPYADTDYNYSPDPYADTDYSQYGSVANRIKGIDLYRREIFIGDHSVRGSTSVDKVKQHSGHPKMEDMSYTQSNCTVSESTSNNVADTAGPILILDSDDDGVESQSQPSALWKPVLEELDCQLVFTSDSEVEIIESDSDMPRKGEKIPAPMTRNITSESTESKILSEKSEMHVMKDDTLVQVLGDYKRSKDCHDDDKVFEDVRQENDINGKTLQVTEECHVEKPGADKSQRNLLPGKSTNLNAHCGGSEDCHNDDKALEDGGHDDVNAKRPHVTVDCHVENQVANKSQRNLLLGKSTNLNDHCEEGIDCSNDKKALEDNGKQIDVNKKRPQIIEECQVENQVADKSQRNLFVGNTNLNDNNSSDSENVFEDDGLGDMWKEMGLAIEYSKGTAEFHDSEHNSSDKEPSEECEHSIILRDDIGYVCRICGIVQKNIEDVFEFQYKTRMSTRTYKYEPQSKGIKEPSDFNFEATELAGNNFVTGFSAHPRHAKQMRPHQVEGFNFLARNLVSDNPSGCILAHAPGSGKTFMIISFIQSFMATYPDARPLIVLPKGILATWKTEFTKWQVEEMPLYDLYSAVADSRSQQLEVLRKWIKERSILFLGYKQFSSIVSGGGNSEAASLCQELMCRVPSILILDEGHTPRNKDTEVVNSISRVRTLRKVVLSGTLYQNHVREVFNILDLVHPKFLQLDASKLIVKRILSRVNMGGVKRIAKGSVASFYDLVEGTLQSDDLKLKVHVINDLREMTKDILHYYKGDFLEDLPGLEDFTVMLNLNAWQKKEAKKLKRIGSVFKRSSVGSAIYLHASLKEYSENVQGNGEKQTAFNDATIDELIKQVDIREGVKAKFFLNVLRLCEVTGEKLLVFSQYLLPLKFLERLTVEVMNWSIGKEIFMINGDSSAEMREMSMDRFNNSASARVFFGSIKACGEGISLVGASRIIILDVHLNPSVSRQAVGRAFRPGQTKKVHVYRLIAAESPEVEDHNTCFRKELISKMWFEWNEHRSISDFELKQVDADDCGDNILESPHIHEDVKALYKR